MSEERRQEQQDLGERGENRSQRPASPAFRAFMATGWGPRSHVRPPLIPAAPHAAERRTRLAARFPGEVIVVPAGQLVTRSNDTDYRFRPHTAFAYLTGLGADREPDAVLVLHPRDTTGNVTHEAVLYFRPRAERDSEELYADTRYGELWVGVRPSLEELAGETGIRCSHLDDLPGALADGAGPMTGTKNDDAARAGIRVVPGSDVHVEGLVARVRGAVPPSDDVERAADAADAALAEAIAELRLVKDAYEVAQMRLAVAATAGGFEKVVSALPRAAAHRRGERVLEGAFGAHAREEGNGVGYETIAAAGDHACTLHWVRNDGAVEPGRLVLVDAGVEVDSLYTADVTRTLPVDGTFTAPQRQVYEAVLEAADAAIAAVRPGATLREVHGAAMGVIARHLQQWGWLPTTAEETLTPEGQFHRRWMVHGTSHHLGIDVHDCAQARREAYLDGPLAPGMVFTVEPGLYVRSDDMSVPAEFRGIGVRIEDDVLVTTDGCENLSAALPRLADDVEAWVRRARAGAFGLAAETVSQGAGC